MKLTAEQIVEWQKQKTSLLLPIIYLRGFAMGDSEIEDTTVDPFNGFNVGSVLLRTGWTGDTVRHVFESPVLRLMQPPYNYRLTFSDGIRGLNAEAKKELTDWANLAPTDAPGPTPQAVIAIYRYYDIDSHVLGEGQRVGMETYGWGLGRLILDLLASTGAAGVYLVAHSMGGLVARTFLQNAPVLDGTHPRLGEKALAVEKLIASNRIERINQEEWTSARKAVRQFFTYGTPHNGISGQGGLGNNFLGIIASIVGFEIDNFSRTTMVGYLDSSSGANSLDGKFPVENCFCLVGTGSADYPVAGGFSRRLIGQLSDGLVEVDNAVVCGPPLNVSNGATTLAARAYVRRAHSGPYGMVNSEEGFGNLSRFLFGDVRVDGDLKVTRLDLPPDLASKAADGAQITASYNFESFLRVRGESWAMNERLARDGTAAFRRYDELFPDEPVPERLKLTNQQSGKKVLHNKLELFTAFLDTQLRDPTRNESVEGIQVGNTMGFALRLRIPVPIYEINGLTSRDNHYEGSSLLDQDLVFLAYQDAERCWNLAWGPNKADTTNSSLTIVQVPINDETAEEGSEAFRRSVGGATEFWIPLNDGPPVIQAWLRLTARSRF